MRPDREKIMKATSARSSLWRALVAKRRASQVDVRGARRNSGHSLDLEAFKIFVILTALTVAMVLAARWLV